MTVSIIKSGDISQVLSVLLFDSHTWIMLNICVSC